MLPWMREQPASRFTSGLPVLQRELTRLCITSLTVSSLLYLLSDVNINKLVNEKTVYWVYIGSKYINAFLPFGVSMQHSTSD